SIDALVPRSMARGEADPLLRRAAEHVAQTGSADAKGLQKALNITRNESETLLADLQTAGVVSELPAYETASVTRSVLVNDVAEARARAGGKPPAEPPASATPPAAPPQPPKRTPPEQALENIKARIDKTPGDNWLAKLRKKVGEITTTKVYARAFDELHPLNKAMRAISGAVGRPLKTVEDAYKQGRLFAGQLGKAHHMLEFGMLRFNDRSPVGPGLREILKPHGKELDNLEAYTVAVRTIELEGRGIKSGMPLEDAKVVAKHFAPKFEAARKQLVTYNHQLLQYLRDSGVITKESYDLMVEANKDHVPFWRVFEETTEQGKSSGSPFVAINRIVGSDRKIHPPLESIIKNTYTFVRLAEKSNVIDTLVRAVEMAPHLGIAKKAEEKARPVRVSVGEQRKMIKDIASGKEFSQERTKAFQEMVEDNFTVFRQSTMRPKDNQIIRFNEGKRELWEVPKDIAEAIEAMDPAAANFLMRTLALPASSLRAGAVLSPDFMARNPLRDTFIAFLQSDARFIPVLDSLGGAMMRAGKTQAYKDWLRGGGAMAELVSLDRAYLQKNVRQIAGQTNLMDIPRNLATDPLAPLQALSAGGEQMTRLGVIARDLSKSPILDAMRELRARRKGKPWEAPVISRERLESAALNSREATLDFARKGTYGRQLNMIYAFSNARAQGYDKMFRTIKDHPGRTMVRGFVAFAIPSMILRIMNEDEEGFDGIARWIKDTHWVWPTRDEDGKQQWHKYPKHHEWGPLFGTLPEKVVEGMMPVIEFKDGGGVDVDITRYDTSGFDDFMSDMMSQGFGSILPNFFEPMVEQSTNYNYFRNAPLIPADREIAFPIAQDTIYTTPLSKKLGAILGEMGLKERPGSIASPIIIDNYVRSWTGGLGVLVNQLMSRSLEAAGVLPPSNRPDDTLADLPVIRAFNIRYPSGSDQRVQDFEESYSRYRSIKQTIAVLGQRPDLEDMLAFREAQDPYMVPLEGMHSTVSFLRRMIRFTYADPSIPSNEKQPIIDQYYFQIIDIAEAGNEIVADVTKAAEEAAAKAAKKAAAKGNQ
ncbi:MAG TPA: LPD38 domain-containing protein, partial [Phycisphaerae bacterium]|nr:LPD38 domain-containing protein [Phycisphaerae bacterium]